MSIIRNVSGPYTINTINHDDPIILDSNVVIINGNLTVKGNTTSISSTNTNIADNIIELNSGWTGAPALNAGITVARGAPSPGGLANVSIVWNETQKRWQITNDGSTFSNISSYTTGVNMQRLSDDPTPVLGGNLWVGSNAIVNTTGGIYMDPLTEVKMDGNLTLKMFLNGAPTTTLNYNTLFASNVGAGGTGLYVSSGDATVASEELISKRRAIIYSIIF
jgi:hypothetical protein